MREGGGCGRITTGTRESERVGMGTSSCSEGRASQRGEWMGGWMDGDGDRLGAPARGRRQQQQRRGEARKGKPNHHEEGEDGMGCDGRDSDGLD